MFSNNHSQSAPKRICKAVALLALMSSLVLAGTSVLASASDVEPKNLLILGDSIATGHSLPDYNSEGNPKSQYSWATLLAEEYGAQQINLAVDGDTTANLRDVVRNQANRAAIEQADVICISIGGNNFLQLMNRLSGEGTLFSLDVVEAEYAVMQDAAADDLDDIFDTLWIINPNARVLVQTLFEPYLYFTAPIFEGHSFADIMGSYVQRYNTMLAEKAGAYGFTVVDVANAFRTQSDETWVYATMKEGSFEDVVAAIAQANPHPTVAGHRGMFETYCREAGSVIESAFAPQAPAGNTPTPPAQNESSNPSPTTDTGEQDSDLALKIAAIAGGSVAVFGAVVALSLLKKKKNQA